MAVKISATAEMETFALSSWDDRCWKTPCKNCVERLTQGATHPMTAFLIEMGTKKVFNLELLIELYDVHLPPVRQ